MSAVPRATLAAAALRRALCLARSNHVPTHHAARAPSSTRGQPSPKMVPKFHHPRVHGWRACVTRAASPAVNVYVDASTEAEDTRYMRMALDEASTAASKNEVPVGAVLVHTTSGKILASHHNTVLAQDDPTAHAEMKCVRDGAAALGGWRHLRDTTLYVTLEPCPMCAGAVLNARLGAVVWGAPNPLIGADGSWIALMGDGGDGLRPCDGGSIDDTYAGSMRDGSSSIDDETDTAAGIGSVEPACALIDPKGATKPHAFKPGLEVRRRVLETECADLMKAFFRRRRTENKETKRREEASGD